MTQAKLNTPIFNIQNADHLSLNVMPLLHEIKHALNNLIENNESSIIDLRSIPLANSEEDKILEILSCGEIQAHLNALGKSEIIESQYAGVWVITHFNQDEEIISRFIEITHIPEILCSQTLDMQDAYNHLDLILKENKPTNISSVEK